MTQNGRGATKMEKPKNGTASNSDDLPGQDFGMASGVLDWIANPPFINDEQVSSMEAAEINDDLTASLSDPGP
jgi:hypothetical protein